MSGLFGTINTATSGLLAQQNALQTIGHNVSNISTQVILDSELIYRQMSLNKFLEWDKLVLAFKSLGFLVCRISL